MTQLTILEYPNERLHIVASPVKSVNQEIRELVKNMAETMYSASGIGLAATQVDVHKRVITIDISSSRNDLLVLINPQLLSANGKHLESEGCLSVPGVFEDVMRAKQIVVRALNEDGKEFEMEAEGLLSVCIQHEIDHLDGKVFIEYLSRLKRERIKKKLKKRKQLSDHSKR